MGTGDLSLLVADEDRLEAARIAAKFLEQDRILRLDEEARREVRAAKERISNKRAKIKDLENEIRKGLQRRPKRRGGR